MFLPHRKTSFNFSLNHLIHRKFDSYLPFEDEDPEKRREQLDSRKQLFDLTVKAPGLPVQVRLIWGTLFIARTLWVSHIHQTAQYHFIYNIIIHINNEQHHVIMFCATHNNVHFVHDDTVCVGFNLWL